jgi:hypothetical protein
MEEVVDARHGALGADSRLHRSRARPARRAKLVNRPLLEVRLQRLVRRVRAVAPAGADDHRGHRHARARATAPTTTAASWPRRSSAHRRGVAAPPRRPAQPERGAARARGAAKPRKGTHGCAPGPGTPAHGAVGSPAPGPDARPARAQRARGDARAHAARARRRIEGDGFVSTSTRCRARRSSRACRPLSLGRRSPRRSPAGSAPSDPRRPPALGDRSRRRSPGPGVPAGREVAAVRYDSRQVTPGAVFVALKGQTPTAQLRGARPWPAARRRWSPRRPAGRRAGTVDHRSRRARSPSPPGSRRASTAGRATRLHAGRHHRDQRQDDDRVPARAIFEAAGIRCGMHRHGGLPHRRARSRPPGRRRRRPTCSGCCARW